MLIRKYYFYIVDLNDAFHPLVYRPGFLTLDKAKENRYKLLGKGIYVIVPGFFLKRYVISNYKLIPKSGISIIDQGIYTTKSFRKYQRGLYNKYKKIKVLRGSENRETFIKNLAKVLNK